MRHGDANMKQATRTQVITPANQTFNGLPVVKGIQGMSAFATQKMSVTGPLHTDQPMDESENAADAENEVK